VAADKDDDGDDDEPAAAVELAPAPATLGRDRCVICKYSMLLDGSMPHLPPPIAADDDSLPIPGPLSTCRCCRSMSSSFFFHAVPGESALDTLDSDAANPRLLSSSNIFRGRRGRPQ